MPKHWIPTIITSIIGCGLWIVERGLDMAHIEVPLYVSILMWSIGGILIIIGIAVASKWYVIPFLKRIRITVTPETQPVISEIGNETKTNKYTIEFYRTRHELNVNRGELAIELESAKKIWVAWWTGISSKSQGVFNNNKEPPIDRVILTDPYGGYLPYLAKIDEIENDEIESTRNFIKSFGDKCKKLKCNVKYFDGAIEGIIIADYVRFENEEDFSDKAWIRVETMVPYCDRKNPCSFVVHNVNKSDDDRDINLFNALIKHYSFIWELSTNEPSHQLDDTISYSHQITNNVMLVLNAISEAKHNTSKSQDTTVYIRDSNYLTTIYPQELYNILLRLQNDDKILKLISFPDCLLPKTESKSRDVLGELHLILNPQENSFVVSLEKKFDKWLMKFGIE